MIKEMVTMAMAKLDEEEEEEEEDDEFHTASNTMIQRGQQSDPYVLDGTVTDLGTLVIVDDADDEVVDTMKSETPFCGRGLGCQWAWFLLMFLFCL